MLQYCAYAFKALLIPLNIPVSVMRHHAFQSFLVLKCIAMLKVKVAFAVCCNVL